MQIPEKEVAFYAIPQAIISLLASFCSMKECKLEGRGSAKGSGRKGGWAFGWIRAFPWIPTYVQSEMSALL